MQIAETGHFAVPVIDINTRKTKEMILGRLCKQDM